MKQFKIIILFLVGLAVLSCERTDLFKIISTPSSKAVTAFSFDTPAVSGTIDEGNHTIRVTVPFGTDITTLQASFATTGVRVEVDGFEQESGTTANNFTFPVVYTVSAADNSTRDYTVTVTVAAPSIDKEITDFLFDSLSATGTIDELNHTINVSVPFGTDVTALRAKFDTTGIQVAVGGVPQESDVTANDFSTAVIYRVTAEDNSTRDYTVTVTVNTGTPYEIINDVTGSSSNGVFGWRPDGNVVANGQSVFIDTDIYLESFAFYVTSNFGADVTLRLNIRDDAGNILQSHNASVGASFSSGWITWPGINRNVSDGTTLIFTVYLVGGYDTNQHQGGLSFDSTAGYAGGDRYTVVGPYADAEIEVFANWASSGASDMIFHLQGIAP